MCELKVMVEKLNVPEDSVVLITMPEHASTEDFDQVEKILFEDEPGLRCKGVTFLLMPYDHKVSIIKKAEVG